MQLNELNEINIRDMLDRHDKDGGNAINDSLSKLFCTLDNEENPHEVSIKVAALNQIYSTAIRYIKPVVEKICDEIKNNHKSYSLKDYVETVDKISTVNWKSPTTNEEHERCNMSFSSKYIHFLSRREVPIYDSYIWIVVCGYMNSINGNKININAPKTYSEFYNVFCSFKSNYNLNNTYTNYEIDKFLWQYGKSLINEVMQTEGVDLEKAKSKLKKNLRNAVVAQ